MQAVGMPRRVGSRDLEAVVPLPREKSMTQPLARLERYGATAEVLAALGVRDSKSPWIFTTMVPTTSL
jgi:hypothetical protein